MRRELKQNVIKKNITHDNYKDTLFGINNFTI